MSTQIGPNTPLNISLQTPPPIGTTTFIRLDSSAQGVLLTTQSSLTSSAPVEEQNLGCIGRIVGLCKRTWTKICSWILYVIRFFIPASPLSAINQTLQRIEESNREQREFIANYLAHLGRSSELPASQLPPLGSTELTGSSTPQLEGSGTETTVVSSTPEVGLRLSVKTLELSATQRRRLTQAHETLIRLERFITGSTPKNVKDDYNETLKHLKKCQEKLDCFALYPTEGSAEKEARTPLNEYEDLVSIETHTKNLSKDLTPTETL